MKKLLFFIFLAVAGLSACNQSAKNKNQSEQTAEVYTCPMHPEVKSDKADSCPKCGMELVKKDEHNHADSSSNVDDEIK
jgi:uncharacterized protein with PIN domain